MSPKFINQEIAKEVFAAHQKLSSCSARFLDFVKENPESLKRWNFNSLLCDKRFEYFRSQPWPTFINQNTKEELKKAALEVYNLITSIPGRLFAYNVQRMSQYYEVPAAKMAWSLYGVNDDHLKCLLSRGDFVLSLTAGLKCLEFNMQTSLGGWELDLLQTLYLNTPILSKFLEKHNIRIREGNFFASLLEHMIKKALKRFLYNYDEINMGLVFMKYIEGQEGVPADLLRNLYKQILHQENKNLKGDLIICDWDSLKRHDNFVVSEKGKRIHVIIEMCNGWVPIQLMDVVKAGNIIICNGPITHLMSNKLNLALLSENKDSDVFSLQERESIEQYIPWTRKVVPGDTTYGKRGVNLEDFMLSQRERLVLKPSEGLGGQGVWVGRHTLPQQWKQQVERALTERRWVVQEYIESRSYLYQAGENGCAQHHAVWGLFIFGSQYAGGFIRILPERDTRGVINSSQGAEESIILEVEE